MRSQHRYKVLSKMSIFDKKKKYETKCYLHSRKQGIDKICPQRLNLADKDFKTVFSPEGRGRRRKEGG